MSAPLLALAAARLVGCPFRLHGRDPLTGLDCVGLLWAAMARIGRPIELPVGYALRVRDLDRWMPDMEQRGFSEALAPFEPGDVILVQPGPVQFHLAIMGPEYGWIHAHAGLRRVVRESAPPAGALIRHWRLASNT